MKKRLQLSFIGLMACLVALAAGPEAGKVYRVMNSSYSLAMQENYQTNKITCVAKGDKKSYTQLWEAVDRSGKIGLRNVYTGRYLQEQNSQSNQFSTGTAFAAVTFTDTKDSHLLINCGGYLHCDAGKSVVNWYDTSNEGDHWTLEAVSLTETEISNARAEYKAYVDKENEFSTYYNTLKSADYSALSQVFEDNACTTLKSEYASMSDADLKAAIAAKGMPEPIQNIAVKVKNGWTDEFDKDMSAQFRVQEYEAYAAAEPWRWNSSDGKGLNASQINDMNNPTGIFTTGREVLFVFVEGKVPTGCELRLSSVKESTSGLDKNGYGDGTTLKAGINIVATETDLREFWVMYTVTDKNKKPADQPKIKIHIEGGNVLGYVNYYPEDEQKTNEEYKKILTAANAVAYEAGADKRCLRLATRGEYGMMYWQLMTYNLIWSDCSSTLLKNKGTGSVGSEDFSKQYKYGYNIWKSMRFYDNVLHQEWATMGILSDVANATSANPVYTCFGGKDLYPTYCNCHAITLMGTNGGNPYSTTGYTHMPGVGAVESSYNGERSNFDVWCVGHESGHNNQGAINLQSSTESSNNLFSNIITYWYGYRMARGGTIADNEKYWQSGTQFSLRDIGMTMMMYFQLYQYYHLAGHKMDFYPTLFADLRSDPMNLNSGNDSWLKFYKKACMAAQEDLTEFFRFWGFFETFTNVTFGDYTNRTCSLSQKEVDDAISYVKDQAAKNGWKENLQIMFIETRQMLRPRTDPWAEAEKDIFTNGISHMYKPEHWGSWLTEAELKSTYGDVGDILTYSGDLMKAGNYTFEINNQTITLTGEGGVGFLIYNDKNEIVGYKNKLSFTLPAEVLISGYTIKVVNADGTVSDVPCSDPNYADNQVLAAVKSAIEYSKDLTNLKDDTGKKVGYYSGETLSQLTNLVNQAKAIINDSSTDIKEQKETLKSLAQQILDESNRLKNGDFITGIVPNGIYTIKNYRDQTRYIAATTTGSIQGATSSANNNSRWMFVQKDKNYYLLNYGTRKMLSATTSGSTISSWAVAANQQEDAFLTKVKSTGNGTFYLKDSGDSSGKTCLNLDGANSAKIAVWSEDAGSEWYITLVDEVNAYSLSDLKALVSSSDSLLKAVGTYSTSTEKLTLQVDDANAPYYISTNKPNADATYSLANCLDNKASTYFMSDQTATGKPYFMVDFGEGNETDAVKFYLTTTSKQLDAKPTSIKVQGANNSGKTTVTTVDIPVKSETNGETFTSDVILATKPYRYWYFSVQSTSGGTTNHFAVSRFILYNVSKKIVKNEGYENVDNELFLALNSNMTSTKSSYSSLGSLLDIIDAYDNLKKDYDALLENVKQSQTSIEIIETPAKVGNDIIYDLTGQRVINVIPGHIYIQNGRKFIAK